MADILTKDAAHRSAMTQGSYDLLQAIFRAYPHIERVAIKGAARC